MATLDPLRGLPPALDVHGVEAIDRRLPRRKPWTSRRPAQDEPEQAEPDDPLPDDPFEVDVYEPGGDKDDEPGTG